MKLLNLCCGATRPAEPWTNLDSLHAALLPGTPERTNLDAESNYVEHDVLSGRFPFADESFDGILASHCIEHWDCQESVRVLRECRRVLKYGGGVVIVSVPDAAYFREVNAKDNTENAERLFGEPIHPQDGEATFLGYGLFNRFHKQVLTEDALWCLMVRAGFAGGPVSSRVFPYMTGKCDAPMNAIIPLLNRRKFSLEMMGVKL